MKLACLEVLALGGRTASDDGIQVGYFALRSVLAHEVSEAAKFIAQRGLVEGAPPIARLITTVAARFGTVVSEKAAAQSVPVIGAVGGADQHGIHGPFPEHGPRAFHRPPPGTQLRGVRNRSLLSGSPDSDRKEEMTGRTGKNHETRRRP